jgi:dTDP-4-dehydrorhamnose reductase
MKILITGSNGLLGQKLVELLSKEKGVSLIATARGKNRLPAAEANYAFHSMDISSKEQVEETIAMYKPDAIIHTAAMTNVDQCENEKEQCLVLNVEAVKCLVEASKRHDCFFLHLSTDFIFDGEAGPYDEHAQPNPVSFYGESKLKAEQIVMESGIDWAIARTVLVYGIAHDMSRSNIILWVKNSLESKKQIQVVNDQWRTPTLAEDLAMGCYLIVKHKAKGIFNISGKDMLTPYDMAIQTADFFGLDKSYITETDGSKFTQTAKRPPKTGFIIDKAVKVLGYNPRSFSEGIEVLASQIQNGEEREKVKV